jgi:hypothetical protein
MQISPTDPEGHSRCVRREVARIEALDRQYERDVDERLRNERWSLENQRPSYLPPYR